MENDYILEMQIHALSRLYELLCECRRHYHELKDLLDPAFHLEECPYREKVEPLEIIFEK